LGSALVGRRAELETLEGLISRSARGGRAVVIEGEAGIGKTRLLEAALARARERGFRVFSAAAEELEIRRPFGVISDCLRLRLPTQSAWEAGAEFQIVEDLVALVDQLTVDGPVVLGLDDIQWADPSSLLVLNRLLRQLPELPVLLVATTRAWPRRTELGRMLGGPAAGTITRLHLGRVPPGECRALVAAMLHASPGQAPVGARRWRQRQSAVHC
jgi:predicted ATPase